MTALLIVLLLYLLFFTSEKKEEQEERELCYTPAISPEETAFIEDCKSIDNMVDGFLRAAYPGLRDWRYVARDMKSLMSNPTSVKTVEILPYRGESEKRRLFFRWEGDELFISFFEPVMEAEETERAVPETPETGQEVPHTEEPAEEEPFDIAEWYDQNEQMIKALTPAGTRYATIPTSKLPKSEAHRNALVRDFYVLGFRNARLTERGLEFEK